MPSAFSPLWVEVDSTAHDAISAAPASEPPGADGHQT